MIWDFIKRQVCKLFGHRWFTVVYIRYEDESVSRVLECSNCALRDPHDSRIDLKATRAIDSGFMSEPRQSAKVIHEQ